MNKKTLLKILVPSVLLGALALGIGIPIATRKNIDKVWKVSLASDSTSRYLVTQMDTTQNKAKMTEKFFIFDVKSDNNKAIEVISTKLGIAKEQVIATITKSNKNYDNGLEKLVYDLKNAKANADKLEFIFLKYVRKDIDMKGFKSMDKAGQKVFITTVLEESLVKSTTKQKDVILIFNGTSLVPVDNAIIKTAIDKIYK